MVIDPPVTFPADGNPKRLMQQEHAALALKMVALSRLHTLAQQEHIDTTPAVLRLPEPLLHAREVKAHLPGPFRRATCNRASASVLAQLLSQAVRWVGRSELSKLKPQSFSHKIRTALGDQNGFGVTSSGGIKVFISALSLPYLKPGPALVQRNSLLDYTGAKRTT
jgi:hypothetical protein